MKRLVLLGLLGILGWMPNQAAAQVSISFNIGSQPLWGPTGYNYVESYYLPDVEAYYSVPRRQFIYLQGSRWIYSSSLPSRYRNYDLYNGYKVVVNSRDPYRNFHEDRVRYSRYRHTRGQQVIRYSNDSRYYVIKGHPHYSKRNHHGHSDRHSSRDYDRRDHHKKDDRHGRDHGRRDNGRDNRRTRL